jgi:hypothetical protein
VKQKSGTRCAVCGRRGYIRSLSSELSLPAVSPQGVMMDVQCEKQLAVLDVSLLNDSPQCMHVYPAVLALAKNTAGATRWSRLLGDSSPTAAALMKSLNISQVRAPVQPSEQSCELDDSDDGDSEGGVEIAHAAVSQRLPIPLSRNVARTEGYTYAANV